MLVAVQTFTPEQNFVQKLNSYLEIPLGLLGQKRVEQWLRQYREEAAPIRQVVVKRVIRKTVIKYINGVRPTKKCYAIEDLLQVISEYFSVPVTEMKTKTRKGEVVLARKYATFFIRKYTPLSLKQTAQCFGKASKDHTTSHHALKSLLDLMDSDEIYKEYMTAIESKILEL